VNEAVPTLTVYSATKGAVDTLTRVLAAELGPRKIRVNAIAPGAVETEGLTPPGSSAAISRRTWWRAPRSAGSASPTISPASPFFLASDDAAWVTGERLTASGGYY
jgi:3-oxoacyl-[acyl-carrier protein] reductase